MPSPLYLHTEITTFRNVACGNDAESEKVVLYFQPVDRAHSTPGHRPLVGPEGGLKISFEPLAGRPSPREQAEGFELGKLYRLVAVEP